MTLPSYDQAELERLHLAAELGQVSVVEHMLRVVGVPALAQHRGTTALHQCCRHAPRVGGLSGQRWYDSASIHALVTLLCKEAGESDPIDSSGRTPLLAALEDRDPLRAMAWLDAGARPGDLSQRCLVAWLGLHSLSYGWQLLEDLGHRLITAGCDPLPFLHPLNPTRPWPNPVASPDLMRSWWEQSLLNTSVPDAKTPSPSRPRL